MNQKVNFQKIKDLREQRGWSQNQLATMSGISLRTIQRMEKDGTASMESIKSLASVFEIDFKEILQGEEPKTNESIDFLKRLEHGKQIASLIGNKEASDFDFDESIKDNKQIETIHSFFQTIMDYNDMWDSIEFEGRAKAINLFEEMIENLRNHKLWIFGAETKSEYENYNPPLIFNVIVIRIYPEDSPIIIKIDLSEPVESTVNND